MHMHMHMHAYAHAYVQVQQGIARTVLPLSLDVLHNFLYPAPVVDCPADAHTIDFSGHCVLCAPLVCDFRSTWELYGLAIVAVVCSLVGTCAVGAFIWFVYGHVKAYRRALKADIANREAQVQRVKYAVDKVCSLPPPPTLTLTLT